MALSDLATIRQKVRRITRSPSPSQLSDADLDQYINTFVQFDIPKAVKLFSLRTLLTFYTQPGVDVYGTNNIPNDPLNDFQNKYTAIHAPIFIAGVQAYFTQERNVFYGAWPQTNYVQQTGLFGNGTTGPFVGQLPPPLNTPFPFSIAQPHVLQNSVLITALDANGSAMQLIDYPVSPTTGALGLPGVPQTLPSPYGQVNYVTGAFTAVFPANTGLSNPPQGNPIWAEAIYYVAGLPTSVLYYDNKFTLRPVPDKSYIVQVEADIIPTELIISTDNPQIKQWWQWIALGAAIKILQDRVDYETVNTIMPEFMNQQALALSTSMEQYANQRTTTIYTANGMTTQWNNFFGYWPY